MSNSNSTTSLKTCPTCKRELPATHFYFHLNKKEFDGFYYCCKECRGSTFGDRWHFRSNTKPGYKICSRCRRELASQNFHKRQIEADGLNPFCKECRSVVRKGWNTEHEKRRAYKRQYDAENRHKKRERDQRRRARKRALPATFTAEQWKACLEWWNHTCAYCGAQQSFWFVLEQDHCISIKDGGGYTADNIVPACKSCNTSKNDNPVANWVRSKFTRRHATRILNRITTYFEWVSNCPDLL